MRMVVGTDVTVQISSYPIFGTARPRLTAMQVISVVNAMPRRIKTGRD
jgi:hypothetical protein